MFEEKVISSYKDYNNDISYYVQLADGKKYNVTSENAVYIHYRPFKCRRYIVKWITSAKKIEQVLAVVEAYKKENGI